MRQDENTSKPTKYMALRSSTRFAAVESFRAIGALSALRRRGRLHAGSR